MAFVVYDKTYHVTEVTSRFNMDSLFYATEIYDTMYEILETKYGAPESSSYQAANTKSALWVYGNHEYFFSLGTVFITIVKLNTIQWIFMFILIYRLRNNIFSCKMSLILIQNYIKNYIS